MQIKRPPNRRTSASWWTWFLPSLAERTAVQPQPNQLQARRLDSPCLEASWETKVRPNTRQMLNLSRLKIGTEQRAQFCQKRPKIILKVWWVIWVERWQWLVKWRVTLVRVIKLNQKRAISRKWCRAPRRPQANSKERADNAASLPPAQPIDHQNRLLSCRAITLWLQVMQDEM